MPIPSSSSPSPRISHKHDTPAGVAAAARLASSSPAARRCLSRLGHSPAAPTREPVERAEFLKPAIRRGRIVLDALFVGADKEARRLGSAIHALAALIARVKNAPLHGEMRLIKRALRADRRMAQRLSMPIISTASHEPVPPAAFAVGASGDTEANAVPQPG